jgi:protein-tyrosine phosphatase
LSKSRQITSKDFEQFNYILAMDNSNFRNIQNLKNRSSSSGLALIKKMQNFRSVFNEQEVPDPYFGGDEGFDYVLDILEDSVSGFLESIS